MEEVPATYPATLDFLYNRLPMFSRLGADAIRKDLVNIQALCRALGNPQHQFKSIHVGGTNGKGSVSHMLSAILQEAGYKTGLYTSPHLRDFRERIRINGEMVTKDFVVAFTRRVYALINDIRPSFFEITVAMAFEWFAQNKCDAAVVEVGLGGRLDSTNIIDPVLSVITNISYDHQQLLGDTLEAIAGEKAGIIKPGRPVVIGETQEETKPVFLEKAAECRAPVVFADQQWELLKMVAGTGALKVTLRAVNNGQDSPVTYTLDLAGAYQAKNIQTVLTAAHLLRRQQWDIGEEHVRKALAAVKKLTGLRGRWDVIGAGPLIIADVAHNTAGIREVMRQVKAQSYQKLHIVAGFVKDKAVEDMLALFPADASCYFCQAAIPRALPADDLAEKALSYGLSGHAYDRVEDAMAAAREAAGAHDMILVCGSVFIVAEALP